MKSEEMSDTVEFGPGPCRDAGLTSVSECTKYMDSNFEKIGPGEWRSTTYTTSSPVGFEADCTAITDLAAKAKCFEDFYVKAQGSFSPDFLAAQPQYDPKNGVPSNSDQASAYFNEFNWVHELAWNVVGASTAEEREKARQQLQEEASRQKVVLTIDDNYPDTLVVKWKDTSGRDFQSEYSYSTANSKEYSNEPVTYPSENTEEEYKKYLEEYQRNQQQEVSPEPISANPSAGSENTAKQPSAPVESTPVENTTAPPVESGDASVLVPEQPATDNTEVSSDQQSGDELPEDSNNHGETSITGSAVREYDSQLSPVTVWILKFLGISSG